MINAEKKYIQINISGMSCANCAAGIKKHLTQKGLKDININFSTGETSFTIIDSLSIEEVILEIKKIGYQVKEVSEEKLNQKNNLTNLFIVCLFFTIPLFTHMFLSNDNILKNPIIQILLCLPVYSIGIYYFGKSAWNSLKLGFPNMDVLIMIGTSAAFLYSISGTIMYWGTLEVHRFLFFETTATIITLVLLGNLLEHRSVKKTTSAIKELSSMQNLTVTLEQNDKSLKKISFNEIQKDDILIVNSGDKIPTDGEITYGEGFLDESMLTGENKPILKSISQQVIGGTILIDGNIKIKAIKIGQETVLSQIINLVRKAQNDKPSIQRMGDKISSIFVPFVLIISILTFLLSYFTFNINISNAIMRSIAVLVISCPCAMGLATPTAVMVGIGRAAKKGILIKGGRTLEKFAQIKTVVFDKTGTLTTGNFKIKNINCINENLSEVKNILYNLELNSSHPIAKSIVNELKNSTILSVNNIKEHKGKGIEGVINQNHYLLGSKKILKNLKDEKKHNLYLLKNNSLIATIDIEDEIKNGIKNDIQKLKRNGIKTIMLSGDKKEKCEKLAKQLNITKVFSEQLPKEKLQKITELNKINPTAMIGDGINDAPALAKSHVGISLSGGTQIAIQSAQIILLNKNDLSQLNESLQISKHTLLTIKQNLFWAFSYNIIAIPIAAFGFLNPMWGALFMAFSDVIVIGNSLRLKNKKIFN